MNVDKKKLRLIILTHGGCVPLMHSLSKLDAIEVAAIFIETERAPKVLTLSERLKRSIKYDGYAETITKFLKQALGMNRPATNVESDHVTENQNIEAAGAELGIPIHYLSNYHLAESIEFMRRQNADLGIVWGTNILKESVFKIPRMGSINIHQGLAPYYRGGPPVFWELNNNEPEVGITVHFVEAKVDTGAIIKQETVPLEYDYAYGLDFESFINDFREKMAPICVRLMTDAVRILSEEKAELRYQDITLGKRYRLPIKEEKDELKRRLIERAVQAGRDPSILKRKKSGIIST